MDDAIPLLEPRSDERAAGAGDALLDIVETLGVSEDRDVAVPKVDEVARRRIAAGEAIGAHGVESGAPAPRSISTAGGRREFSAPPLRAAIELSLAGTTMSPSMRRATSASTRRRSLAASSLVETIRRS